MPASITCRLALRISNTLLRDDSCSTTDLITACGGAAGSAVGQPQAKPVLTDVKGKQHAPFKSEKTKAVVFVFMLRDCPCQTSTRRN